MAQVNYINIAASATVADILPLCHCTGKSTSLRNILSIFGAEKEHIHGADTVSAALVNKASSTTVPLGLDDCTSSKKVEMIAVQFFNGFSHVTVSKGTQKPKTSILLTANQPFTDTQR